MADQPSFSMYVFSRVNYFSISLRGNYIEAPMTPVQKLKTQEFNFNQREDAQQYTNHKVCIAVGPYKIHDCCGAHQKTISFSGPGEDQQFGSRKSVGDLKQNQNRPNARKAQGTISSPRYGSSHPIPDECSAKVITLEIDNMNNLHCVAES